MMIREESAISLAQDDGGLMNAPNMKAWRRFEVSVENVPPGVILKEFERTVKLNKATNPQSVIEPDFSHDPYVEKRKIDGGRFAFKKNIVEDNLTVHLRRTSLKESLKIS